MRALLMTVGPELYALPVGAVLEVIEAPRTTSLPTAPVAVRGLVNVRGEIVPLFDTAVLTGLVTAPAAQAPFAVVVESARGPAALSTDAIPEIADLGEELGPADVNGGVALRTAGGRIAALLDVELLLAAGRAG